MCAHVDFLMHEYIIVVLFLFKLMWLRAMYNLSTWALFACTLYTIIMSTSCSCHLACEFPSTLYTIKSHIHILMFHKVCIIPLHIIVYHSCQWLMSYVYVGFGVISLSLCQNLGPWVSENYGSIHHLVK